MITADQKEWIAVDEDEEIVEKADTRDALVEKIDTEPCPECGHRTTDLDIMAVPKAHESFFI